MAWSKIAPGVQIFVPYLLWEYGKLLSLSEPQFPHTSVLQRVVEIKLDYVCKVPSTEEVLRTWVSSVSPRIWDCRNVT